MLSESPVGGRTLRTYCQAIDVLNLLYLRSSSKKKKFVLFMTQQDMDTKQLLAVPNQKNFNLCSFVVSNFYNEAEIQFNV